MGISCGATLIKYLLFLFNILWLLLGGVVLWLGFKIAMWSGDLEDIYHNNLKTGAIVVLAAGFLIFVLAFLGCCGAIKQNSCMLSTYGGLILILVVLQCVGAYFVLRDKGKIQDNIKDEISKNFQKWNDGTTDDVAKSIQLFQMTFECCGVKGDRDYTDAAGVPSSCCDKWAANKDHLAKETCSRSQVKWKEGCADKLEHTLTNYMGGLGGVAIALVLIQLLIIVSACCLSREVRG
ncbi:unnamed protein product [Oppiella nova]|uniref:Tetraspanin n=1 Tax=Oppiella nova TaxID=334625 RepID=A0A7R9QZQ0_9ACAR|nr:unnamed protein product [Oppiella nova]CAG2180438.1 unnamed protein product [Oppiella nova]